MGQTYETAVPRFAELAEGMHPFDETTVEITRRFDRLGFFAEFFPKTKAFSSKKQIIGWLCRNARCECRGLPAHPVFVRLRAASRQPCGNGRRKVRYYR